MRFNLRTTLIKWKQLKAKRDSQSIDHLEFSKQWIDHLTRTLRQHRHDKEFVVDLLNAASIYFKDRMSEEEKVDAFVYLLGLYERK